MRNRLGRIAGVLLFAGSGCSLAGSSLPPGQVALCNAADAGAKSYRGTSGNEIQRTALRDARRAALQEAVPSLHVEGWEGTVDEVTTTFDGKATLSIKLPCTAEVKTWNNTFSDSMDGNSTLVAKGSPLYARLATLSRGTKVRFSGDFIRDSGKDYLRESSVSEAGSMTDPEFIFRFSDVSPR